MKTAPVAALGAMALALVTAGAGYWLGQRVPARDVLSAAAPAASAPSAPKARKLLYYRNPMGLSDTSPTPKKDPMGMDYIAVFEGEDEAGSASSDSTPHVSLSTEKIQKLGVRTEAAQARSLQRQVRAARRAIDERGLATLVEVDGGIRRHTVPQIHAAGADLIVPGSLMFGGDPAELQAWLATLPGDVL